MPNPFYYFAASFSFTFAGSSSCCTSSQVDLVLNTVHEITNNKNPPQIRAYYIFSFCEISLMIK